MTDTKLSDLPVDIFLLICNHLDAAGFVSLTSTCRSLHYGFSDEPAIWSRLIRSTFRVANQPVVEHDGARWKKLYRKLKKQTRAYTWGSNSEHCLGQTRRWAGGPGPGPQFGPRYKTIVSWPEEMDNNPNIGVISEMQCGGWSTSLLNSNGVLLISGVLDGMDHSQVQIPSLHAPLPYPPGFSPPQHAYNSITAVKQFSHGRQHLLAVSDSGRIWSWNAADRPAWHVKFLQHQTVERQSGRGTVVKVCAGWSKSAALVEGSGIIVWDPLRRAHNDHGEEDTALVQDSEVVPDTDTRSDRAKHHVRNFIVLEGSIVFVTFEGSVYYSRVSWENSQRISRPQEIELGDTGGKAVDVQGSFRSFAIFTDTGSVLIYTEERLFSSSSPSVDHERIPALQQQQVIALAFGDYHFHALHAPGHITSYGKEPRSCGAFGLGTNTPEARLRGIRQQGMHGIQHRGGDSYLVPHAYVQGRRVWFEREKREWIKFIASGGTNPSEAVERIRMALGSPQVDAQGEVSEWIEQEGRDWEDKYHVPQSDDGLPAYFALNVAAAGWHSGALVLVDEELAESTRTAIAVPDASSTGQQDAEALTPPQGYVASWFTWAYNLGRWFLGVPSDYAQATGGQTAASRVLSGRDPTVYGAAPRPGYHFIWANEHFPRLRLANGTDMPGEVSFDSWRYGRPDFSTLSTQ